jgi:hypothetical protein
MPAQGGPIKMLAKTKQLERSEESWAVFSRAEAALAGVSMEAACGVRATACPRYVFSIGNQWQYGSVSRHMGDGAAAFWPSLQCRDWQSGGISKF